MRDGEFFFALCFIVAAPVPSKDVSFAELEGSKIINEGVVRSLIIERVFDVISDQQARPISCFGNAVELRFGDNVTPAVEPIDSSDVVERLFVADVAFVTLDHRREFLTQHFDKLADENR